MRGGERPDVPAAEQRADESWPRRSLRGPDAEGAVGLLHALPTVLFEFEEGPDCVHVLRHDVGLLVDRLEVVQPSTVHDVNPVPPHGDLVEVRAVPRQIPRHLHDLGRRLDAVAAGHRDHPRKPFPDVEDLIRRCGLLQVDAHRVQVHDRRRDLHRNRVDVQLRQDALDIRAVMARHLELGFNRVNRAFLRVARVRRAADHDGEDFLHPDVSVERIEGADEARRIAGGHADERRAEAVFVVCRGIERQVRQGVFLAALPDRLDPRFLVQGLVAAFLRRAIDNEIGFLDEVRERARRLHAGVLGPLALQPPPAGSRGTPLEYNSRRILGTIAMSTADSVSRSRSSRRPVRYPIAPCLDPIPRMPVTRAIASSTVRPAFTLSATRGGYVNPGPWPTVMRPDWSTTAQYCTSKYSEISGDHTSPASIPTPKSPPPSAAFARLTAPWSASSPHGCSGTSVRTRTAPTRAGSESAWKTRRAARTFTRLSVPTETRTRVRRRPVRSMRPARMRREVIGKPSCAKTIGTARISRGRSPWAVLAPFKATATACRSADTTRTSRSGRSSAGPYASSIGSIRAGRQRRVARSRFRFRSRTA